MNKHFNKTVWFFMLLILPVTLYAQKDVTQFLGIPVDGSKSEMIQELKAKGYTISKYDKDILVGEFNGTDVNIYIATNNNKVCRIMVADAQTIGETSIRIRFNKLIQQFQNNKKYVYLPESSTEYNIPEGEDISYELTFNNKRYEAIFYQKTAELDSLANEMGNLLKKETLNDAEKERGDVIMAKMKDESNFNKIVWFMINENNGQYYISMFYDNQYNRANGEGL